jgi:hypothetical protein
VGQYISCYRLQGNVHLCRREVFSFSLSFIIPMKLGWRSYHLIDRGHTFCYCSQLWMCDGMLLLLGFMIICCYIALKKLFIFLILFAINLAFVT